MGEPVGLPPEVLQNALDPVAFVNGRILYGGPAPEECQRRLPEYRAQLQGDQAAVTEKERRLTQALEKQEKAIAALLT
jgi:argininosuccinate lyase